MAPQQNSTFIDENTSLCQTMKDLPEVIKHYSPILPLKNKQNDNNKQDFRHKRAVTDANEEPYRVLNYKNCHNENNNRLSGRSCRSRSISLFGVNSTMAYEQGYKEITIWLGNEVRYVSGVTNKTTCNDIIKAMIDDELSNGNDNVYSCVQKDGTASRDYSGYVITESWRGIERSYDGNMAILPIWKAWNRVHNEIRLSLKHHKDVKDPTKIVKTSTALSSLRKYFCKLLNFRMLRKEKPTNPMKSLKDQPNAAALSTNHLNKIPNPLKKSLNNKDGSKPIVHDVEVKFNKDKLYRLSETRSTVQKRHKSPRKRKINKKSNVTKRHDKNHDISNYLRRRKDPNVRCSIRSKLAKTNAEMNELYDREYTLTRQLTNKCRLYRLQNELYTKTDKNFEISVGQIQHNIENCAQEIIRTEHELLHVKNEIKQDISIINSLKRLALETNSSECQMPKALKKVLRLSPSEIPDAVSIPIKPTNEQMQFVDNIYEFCDNNASLLV
uniref:Ras-associating domain-containing protein n=1 Tax=Glossina brevipalpis TaxID=37001 RepID=A0A1A9WE16_9MUSC